jgi:hypothetical protein
MSALDSQVGGDHYKKQRLQPFEICYETFGYQGVRHSAYVKILKYLVRDKDDHRQNLEKAIHVLQIQLQFLDKSIKESKYE